MPRNKKLSCRRETARFFVSLNISRSQSRSLKIIQNDSLITNTISIIEKKQYLIVFFNFNFLALQISEIIGVPNLH